MSVGIVALFGTMECESCEDNCDGEDSDGVPCRDIEGPPCYEMCQDRD